MNDTPTFEQKPFKRTRLEKSKDDVFPVRVNAEERATLEELKRVMHCPKDVTVLKQAMILLYDDIHGKGKMRFFEWISEARRIRER